jgi:hypothetical protein
MDRPPEVFFHEEQQFDRGWTMLILVSSLAPLAIIGAGLFMQLVLNRPFGDRPAPDGLLIALFLAILALNVVLCWMFLAARLTTEVRPDGLFIRFQPFHRHERRIDGIRSWKARDYRPIREYGGWGIRWTWRGDRAFNVGGSRGVELVLEEGGRLMIGSKRADELAAALDRAFGTSGT